MIWKTKRYVKNFGEQGQRTGTLTTLFGKQHAFPSTGPDADWWAEFGGDLLELEATPAYDPKTQKLAPKQSPVPADGKVQLLEVVSLDADELEAERVRMLAAYRAALSAKRQAKEMETFVYVFSDDTEFNVRTDAMNINRLQTAYQKVLADENATIEWKISDGVYTTINKDIVVALHQGYAAYIQKLFDFERVRSLGAADETAAEIEARHSIIESEDWPNKVIQE